MNSNPKKHAFRGFLLSHGEVWAHTLGDPGAFPYKTAAPIRPWLCARGTSEVPGHFFAIFGIIVYNKEIGRCWPGNEEDLKEEQARGAERAAGLRSVGGPLWGRRGASSQRGFFFEI